MSQIDIDHLASLANLSFSHLDQSKEDIQTSLESTLEYVSQIKQAKTENISETHQVTNLENVFREDKINPKIILSQQQALQNASHTHQGYIVVDQLIET